MKHCNKCNQTKEYTEFHKRKDKYQPTCKACKKEIDKTRYEIVIDKDAKLQRASSRRAMLRESLTQYMLNKQCTICEESDRACLQFDHRDDCVKEFNVSDGIHRCFSWKRILTEIDKCDILCANCHAKRTAIQQGWYTK